VERELSKGENPRNKQTKKENLIEND